MSARAGVADGELIVRFASGIVSVPNRLESDFSIHAMAFLRPSDAAALRSIGVERFRLLAPSWRNLDEKQPRDRHGQPVEGLADFTNVYVLTLSPGTDTAEARRRLEATGLAHWVAFSVILDPHGRCTDDVSHPAESFRYGLQWALNNDGTFPNDDIMTAVPDVDVNLPEARAIHSVNTTKIAILDTGVRHTHEDLLGNYDFAMSTSFVGAGSGNTGDDVGHGTASASIAAATMNNGIGVASPGGEGSVETLVNVKVGQTGGFTMTDLIEGIEYAVSEGIPVLSMSLGYCRRGTQHPEDDPSLLPLRDAARNAFLMGSLIVASTGNPGLSPVCAPPFSQVYPAAFEQYALGVGHILPDGTRGAFPEGYYVDVVAPGGHAGAGSGNEHAYMVVPCRTGDQDYAPTPACNDAGGTSASAPLAAGIAALLWSFEPDLTNEDVAEALVRTARDYGPVGPDHQWGAGLVRADAAMELVGCCNAFEKAAARGVDAVTLVEGLREQRFRNVEVLNPTPDTWRTTYARLYRVAKKITLDGGDTVVDWWARSRSCATWPDTLSYDARWQTTWADVGEISAGTGTIFGYVYEVFADAAMQEALGWYPFHPGSAHVAWSYSTIAAACGSAHAARTRRPEALDVTGVTGERSTLRFRIPRGGEVAFDVFDVLGRRVHTWRTRPLGSGVHETRWPTGGVAAGVYFVRMTLDREVATTKLVVR